MSDLGKLRATLRDTARDGPVPDEAHSFTDAGDGAAQMLAFIDRTVLGRRITFAFDAGTEISVIASGRRLIRLVPPAPKALTSHQGLFDLSDIRADQAGNVAALLTDLCTGRREFRASVDAREGEPDPVENGIAPSDILAELGMPTASDQDAAVQDTLGAFLDIVAPRVRAALWIVENDITVALGEDEDAAALSDGTTKILAVALDPGFPLSATLETDGILTFQSRPSGGTHRLIAGRLGQFLVAEVSDEDEAATLAAWRQTAG